MRYLVPLFLLGAAGWCWWEATDGDTEFIFFPFIDKIVSSTAGDYPAMGKASAALLAVVALAIGLNGLRQQLKERKEDG